MSWCGRESQTAPVRLGHLGWDGQEETKGPGDPTDWDSPALSRSRQTRPLCSPFGELEERSGTKEPSISRTLDAIGTGGRAGNPGAPASAQATCKGSRPSTSLARALLSRASTTDRRGVDMPLDDKEDQRATLRRTGLGDRRANRPFGREDGVATMLGSEPVADRCSQPSARPARPADRASPAPARPGVPGGRALTSAEATPTLSDSHRSDRDHRCWLPWPPRGAAPLPQGLLPVGGHAGPSARSRRCSTTAPAGRPRPPRPRRRSCSSGK